MPSRFEPLQRGERILYGCCGGVWIMLLFAPPILGDIQLARPSLRTMRERYPGGFPLITWVLPSAGLSMDADSRNTSAAITQEFAASLISQATLVEGSGFQAATVRAIISGIDLLARSKAPKKTFAELRPCVDWSIPYRVPGASPLSATEVFTSLQTLRATFA